MRVITDKMIQAIIPYMSEGVSYSWFTSKKSQEQIDTEIEAKNLLNELPEVDFTYFSLYIELKNVSLSALASELKNLSRTFDFLVKAQSYEAVNNYSYVNALASHITFISDRCLSLRDTLIDLSSVNFKKGKDISEELLNQMKEICKN
jgi:hypothetical protein